MYIPANEILRQFWWEVFDKAILENKFSSKPTNLEIKRKHENLASTILWE